jgi:uncharacterized protein (TIGR03083 family)
VLAHHEYLAHIDADAHLLGAAAALGLDADVPCCPGWKVADLLRHITRVHASRVDIIGQGLIDRWPPRRQKPGGVEPLEWYRSVASELSRVLAGADPEAPAMTHVRERTVGFWIRRMAHETLVHRVDAEQAHGYESAVDPELAVDGVAELLEVLVPNFPDDGEFVPDGTLVEVATAGRSWLIQPGQHVASSRQEVVERSAGVLRAQGEPGATISGEPDRIMLWLWGRVPLPQASVDGDIRLAERLRKICSI